MSKIQCESENGKLSAMIRNLTIAFDFWEKRYTERQSIFPTSADKRHHRQIVIDEMQAECTNQIVSNVSNVIQGINYVYIMKYLTVKLKSRAVQ